MEPTSPFGLAALQTHLAQPDSWLGGPNATGFATHLAAARAHLREAESTDALAAGPVVVAEEQPAPFLAAAFAALARGLPVALARPHWGAAERAQAAAQLRPGLWFGPASAAWPAVYPQINYNPAAWPGAILVPTGGTGGRVRWALHDWTTLAAAARALDAFLGDGPFTHVSTLPPWHVSGLLPAVRALETSGRLWLDAWKSLEAGAPPATAPERAIISLVPTQLLRLLDQPTVVEWLRASRAILLGGAAPSSTLLKQARDLRLPVALAYGLTETAAVVAAQLPADFLAGQPPCVTPLPHAHLWIADDSREPQLPDTPGRICIEADSLFLGYYPNRREPDPFATDDEGQLDRQGRLSVLGRRDRLIITGGEKVDPRLVEDAVRAAGLVDNVFVAGAPDPDWGERVVAIYTGIPRAATDLRAALEGRLAPSALPKSWIHAEHLPLDERGKPDHAALAALLHAVS
jgi:O-succinylbenzoic acid--CoA ligase